MHLFLRTDHQYGIFATNAFVIFSSSTPRYKAAGQEKIVGKQSQVRNFDAFAMNAELVASRAIRERRLRR